MDVVLVDSDSRAVKNAQNLDVLVIHGDLTTRDKLHEAGIGEAAVFVAATNSDETKSARLCSAHLMRTHELSGSIRTNHCLTICQSPKHELYRGTEMLVNWHAVGKSRLCCKPA
jgi:nucleoside-diphosphate-sugar epimerase